VAIDPSGEGHEQHLQGVNIGRHGPIVPCLFPYPVTGSRPAEFSDTTGEDVPADPCPRARATTGKCRENWKTTVPNPYENWKTTTSLACMARLRVAWCTHPISVPERTPRVA
jgi:hypothetical protein